uniref:formyltransferase family protein n=4 Tax=Roseivirga sp. TaxID=1964215 RepID=UPI0040480775
MKIFVLCNSDALAFPTIVKLKEEGFLAGVGIIESSQSVLMPMLQGFNLGVELLVLERKSWKQILDEEIKSKEIDTVWVLTFPWKIPPFLLNLPIKGFINFHFGILPKYKGIDPIFWQFKNKEPYGGVTIHLMNEQIDEGPVILQKQVPIMLGETYGFHCLRLGNAILDWIPEVLATLGSAKIEYLDLPYADAIINQKPLEKDLIINWNSQTSEEIEWLVNASNPKYGGAKTTNNKIEMHILEVTPVTMNGDIDAEPGVIVHADATYGIVVCCVDKQCLRITIVRTKEGYLSGVKLFNLGFTVGHKFG